MPEPAGPANSNAFPPHKRSAANAKKLQLATTPADHHTLHSGRSPVTCMRATGEDPVWPRKRTRDRCSLGASMHCWAPSKAVPTSAMHEASASKMRRGDGPSSQQRHSAPKYTVALVPPKSPVSAAPAAGLPCWISCNTPTPRSRTARTTTNASTTSSPDQRRRPSRPIDAENIHRAPDCSSERAGFGS